MTINTQDFVIGALGDMATILTQALQAQNTAVGLVLEWNKTGGNPTTLDGMTDADFLTRFGFTKAEFVDGMANVILISQDALGANAVNLYKLTNTKVG